MYKDDLAPEARAEKDRGVLAGLLKWGLEQVLVLHCL